MSFCVLEGHKSTHNIHKLLLIFFFFGFYLPFDQNQQKPFTSWPLFMCSSVKTFI